MPAYFNGFVKAFFDPHRNEIVILWLFFTKQFQNIISMVS